MFSSSFISAPAPKAVLVSAILQRHRQIHTSLPRGLDRQLVAGIGVPHDAGARIGGEHPLQPPVAPTSVPSATATMPAWIE